MRIIADKGPVGTDQRASGSEWRGEACISIRIVYGSVSLVGRIEMRLWTGDDVAYGKILTQTCIRFYVEKIARKPAHIAVINPALNVFTGVSVAH